MDTARHHGIPDGCILEFDIHAAPPETGGFDPLSFITGGGRHLLLREAVSAIHRAADDPRVAGLIARVQVSAAPPGPVQELREAVAAFSAVKPSLAWAETYPGTLSYYLASAFGEVWMQPSGTVGLVGFATNAMFLRSALEKAGIEAEFVAREYKSAANLFTEDRYTDAHREADARMIESLHGQVLRGIAESRDLDAAALNELADKAPLLRDDAVTARLIDRIGFRDEAYSRMAELIGIEGVSPKPVTPTPRTTLRRGCICRGTRRPARAGLRFGVGARPSLPSFKRDPAIAVVTVAGPIVSGRGGPQVLPIGRASAGGDTIAAGLREAGGRQRHRRRRPPRGQPGGSVTASETIWREVCRLRSAGKPVVASMGSVAASGGYYVSMDADTIVANPGTITGSIGVVTGKLVARQLKIGSVSGRIHCVPMPMPMRGR